MSFLAFSHARCLGAASAALLLALIVTSDARAGSYTVRACDATNTNRSWSAVGDTNLVASDASCLADATRGMKVRNSLRPPGGAPVLAPQTVLGGLQVTATNGTAIVGLHADATAYDEMGSSGVEGWRAGIRSDGRHDVWCAFQQACSWIGPPTRRIDLALNTGSVQLITFCWLTTGCQRDRVRAAATLKDITLDVRDDLPPALTVKRGTLWGGGAWLQGTASLGIDGGDNAGVRFLTLEAGGVSFGGRELPCDYYTMHPCPAEASLDASIDTNRLPDGPNTVVARVTDAGGAVAEQRATVNVDNGAPTVGTPEVRGGSDWRAANAFELGIDARDPARGSGVQSLAWEVCRLDGTECVTRSVAGNPPTLAVGVPRLGEWKVRAWATDALRSGPRGPWSAPLRFDGTTPGAAKVDAGDGWTTGAGTSPIVVSFPDTSASGPSGVAGYAVARGDAAPGTAVTHRGDRAVVDLGQLPEGATKVRARAISGAGVASDRFGEGVVRIDRTPPVVRLSTDGAPLVATEGEWLRQGVRLTARAADQAQLSGMDPAPDGEPLARGGYLEYQVDDATTVRVRDDRVTIDLPDDGLHLVTVRAFDRAGNVSDPQRASFRVDRGAPTGTVERIDHLAPRRLRANVAEECIDSVLLELRAEGGRDWKGYPAQAEKRAVTGVVPDDRLPVGDYVARFRVRDCAGNEGLIYYGSAVSPMSLRLPLRDTLVLDAGMTAGRARGAAHATVRSGTPVLVRGRLTTVDGGYVAGRRVEFQERIGTGDWRLRAARVTDDTGRASATLRAGPSRRIRLVVADTEQTIGAASRTLAVAVPARATLRASRRTLRNGQAVRFTGRLLGGHVPRRGRELELQGFNPLKGRWQPVRTQGLRTTGRGRYGTTYRFTATIGATVTYRFRVRVAPRPDHPFAEGFSRAVSVTVRG